MAAGCTEHVGPVTEHEADRRVRDDVGPTQVSPSENPSKEAEEVRAKVEQSKDPINEILLPMAKKVLDPERIRSKDAQVNYAMREELREFNAILIDLQKKSPNDASIQQVIKDYAAAMTLDCEKLKASCQGFRYFRLAYNSSQVAKLAAKQETSMYYRLLFFAVELKKVRQDSELFTLLLARSSELGDQVEKMYLKAAISELETALMMARNEGMDETKTREFLDQIKVWDFLQLEGLSAVAIDAAYSMIASSKYIYVAGTKVLQENFKKALGRQRTNLKGRFVKQEELKLQTLFKPEAVDARLDLPYDEVAFVLDSITTGKMTADTGAEMVRGMGLSLDALESAVKHHLRLLFAYTLYKSTIKAKEIFGANVEVKKKLEYAKRRSSEVASLWGAMTSDIRPLKNFTSLAAKSLGADQKRIENIESLFNTMGKSINLSASYPHLYVLFYQLAQLNFKVSVQTSMISSEEYDSGQLMNMLFMGLSYPVLAYSDYNVPLSEFEILYAFDMGVRSAVFDQAGLDVDTFMSDIIRRITGDSVKHIDFVADRFNKTIKGHPAFQEFKRACAEFKVGEDSAPTRRVFFWDAFTSPYYGKMMADVWQPLNPPGEYFNSGSRAGMITSPGAFMFDMNQSEVLEKARVDLERLIRIGETMMKSYTSYLRKFEHLSEDQILAKTAATRGEIDILRTKQRFILAQAKQWFSDYGRCYLQIKQRDDQFKMKLWEYEKAHYRQVHRDIMDIRAGKLTSEQASAKYHFTGVQSDYKGSDVLKASGVNISRVTMMVRMGRYVDSGLVTDKETLEPASRVVTWDYGKDLTLNNRKLMIEDYQRFIPFDENETVFLDNVAKILFGNAALVGWFGNMNLQVSYWEDFISTVTALYRLDVLLNGDAHTIQVSDVMDIQDRFVETMKMRKDTYELYLTAGIPGEISDLGRLQDLEVDMGYSPRIVQYIYGSLDLPGRLMNTEILGYDYALHDWDMIAGPPPSHAVRFGTFNTSRVYYASRSIDGRSNMVIPFNAELDAFLDTWISNWTKRDFKGALDFHREAAAYALAAGKRPNPDDRPRLDLTTSLRVGEPYYNQYLTDNYNVKVRDFNRDTGNCLTGTTECPEFKVQK